MINICKSINFNYYEIKDQIYLFTRILYVFPFFSFLFVWLINKGFLLICSSLTTLRLNKPYLYSESEVEDITLKEYLDKIEKGL